jgi:competence ComEA-like helix-hairpin-helix protein
MWKDFFYFSKSQRIGILVLLFFVVILGLTNLYYSYFSVPKSNTDTDTEFISEAIAFDNKLAMRDSVKHHQWNRKFEKEYNYKYSPQKHLTAVYELFIFDPNTADSITLIKLGLKPYMASNILKFRSKGGTFKTADDFAKMYGLSAQKFQELKPYIQIAPKQLTSNKPTKATIQKSIQENIHIDLNSADTTELMKVKGIGRSYAKSIIRFRQQAGGFTCLEQLKEIYGMTDTNYEKIYPYCLINKDLVKLININTASVDKLNAHPYLNFYESKAIYEYRRRKGKIKNMDELKNITEIKPESLQKIKDYLAFE